MARLTEPTKQLAVPPAAPVSSAARLIASPADAEHAIGHALTALRYKEAVRFGALGDTGCGKSRLMRAIINRYLQLLPGVVLVVDQGGGEASWGGQIYSWPDELQTRAPQPEPRIVVFKGDGTADERLLVAVSELAWDYGLRGRPTLVILDEAADAVHPQAPGTWRTKECMSIARLFKQGRKVGASVGWATQFPQEVPLAMLNETEDVFAFRLAGSALNNLRKKDFTDANSEAVLKLLPDTKAPPKQRGAHLWLRRGHQWDGRVYRVLR